MSVFKLVKPGITYQERIVKASSRRIGRLRPPSPLLQIVARMAAVMADLALFVTASPRSR